MRIVYLPPLSDRLGVQEEEVALEAPTALRQLITDLTVRHGQELAQLLFDPSGNWSPQVGIFIDGRAVMNAEHLVEPGAQVILIPQLAGG